MVNNNYPYQNFFPFSNIQQNSEAEVKLNEDQYEVYVNGNYVGQKTLKNQGEKLSDIDDFLRIQGISDFSSSLDGDHYTIQANAQDNDIANALSVYFNNR